MNLVAIGALAHWEVQTLTNSPPFRPSVVQPILRAGRVLQYITVSDCHAMCYWHTCVASIDLRTQPLDE